MQKFSKCVCLGRAISEYVSDQRADSVDKVQSWSVYPGGSAANVACGLARLNCPVEFVGCVGEDDEGVKLVRALEECGVKTKGIRKVSDSKTGWLWTLRGLNGEITFHAPEIPYDDLADAQLSSFDIDPVWFDANTIFCPQSALLGAERSRAAILYSQDLIEKIGGITVFDGNYREFAWQTIGQARKMAKIFAARSTILKVTLDEARTLFERETVEELGALFPEVQGILLTKGMSGCDYLLWGNRGNVKAYQVEAVDANGAGDAFLAAFISRILEFGLDALSDKSKCEEFLRFSNAAGAICVTKLGANNSLPTAAEINELMGVSK